MSTSHFLRTVSFRNYRTLEHLDISGLQRINILGGLNATGKTTVLDGLFLLFDQANPTATMRPQIVRGLPISGIRDFNQLFTDFDTSRQVTISAVAQQGTELTIRTAPRPSSLPITVSSDANSHAAPNQESAHNSDGLLLEVKADNKVVGSSFVGAAPNGVTFQLIKASVYKGAPCTYINAAARTSPSEECQRYTTAVRSGKTEELLSAVKTIGPQVTGFQLLQDSAQPVLHASLSNGDLLPVSMLGGGFHTVLLIALALLCSPNSLLLLDEFDAAIHYSTLDSVWRTISRLAFDNHCQVIAVTHSKECILSAHKVIAERADNDILYGRLERQNGSTNFIPYTGAALEQSLADGWEIR